MNRHPHSFLRATRGAALSRICRVALTAAIAALVGVGRATAQLSLAHVTLYVNPQTHAVYTEPGKGRVLLGEFSQTNSTQEVQQRQIQRNQAALLEQQNSIRAEVVSRIQQQQQWNQEISKEVSDMQPAWREFGDTWYKKISIGTLVYGDWGMWTHTGWGPQFNENTYTPGPGNSGFNSFDITRAYLDTRFSPNADITMRLTPEMFRQFNTAQPDKLGRLSAVNNNLDGQEGVRIKYAYLDYESLFKKYCRSRRSRRMSSASVFSKTLRASGRTISGATGI